MPRGSILLINDQLSLKDIQLKDLHSRLEALQAVIAQVAVLTTQSEVSTLVQEFQQGREYIGLKQLLELEKDRNKALDEELERTRERLEEALKDKSREDVIERVRRETAEAGRVKLEEIRADYARELSALREEKTQLLEELEAEQFNNKSLEELKEEEERALRRKINALESALQQATFSYQKAISEKKVLKLEEQSIEKKLLTKDSKIEELRKELSSLKELKPSSLLEVPPESDRMQRLFSRTGLAGTRIKKTIKGGKAQKLRVMGMFSPLASLSRDEESPKS